MYNSVIVVFISVVFQQANALYDDPLNVGTVLFSNSDLKKNKWTENEVGLMRAREHFQHVIPPRNLLYSVNDNFIDNLLDYFRTGYSAIKREATDPTTDKTMTIALSDAIGGYLKSWVLPITKFAYYGGSISQDNAIKIFNFYKDVKRYLKTDGKGWNDPDPELLNLVEINIEPPKHTFRTRSLKNPCQYLAYFIKTPVGLVVPTPCVKWSDEGSTMFLPLKNDSLVPLESESAMKALFKYYDVAKNCIETTNQGDQNFDERFQTWLSTDIVPHLNDDKLYIGLGNVLSLFNGTKNDDGYEETFNDCFKISFCKYFKRLCNVDFTSKKAIVISLIIVLEIVWCIPTLILLLCKRRKAGSSRSSGSSCSLTGSSKKKRREGIKMEKKGKKVGRKLKSQTASRVQIDSSDYEGLFKAEEAQNVGTMCSSVSKISMGTCTQSFFSSNVCSAEIAKIIYESPKITNKRSSKQILTQKSDANVLGTRQVMFPEIDSNFHCKSTPLKIDRNPSRAFNPILEPSPTVTLLNSANRTVNKFDSKHDTCCCSAPPSSTETVKNVNFECSCTPCIEIINEVSKQASANDCKAKEMSKSEVKSNTYSEIETATTTSKTTRLRIQKERKPSKNKGIKLSNTKPYVEIKIERPQNEISVGISTVARNKPPTSPRPSKIPKRSVRSGGDTTSSPKPLNPPEDRLQRKSFIPQPRKQILAAADDIVIKRSSVIKTNKLNVTL